MLSGFLITNILLEARSGDENAAATIARFFIRRAARIWPPYFFMLGCFVLLAHWLHFKMMRESLPWHALFLSNFWYALHGPEPWPLQHLWTLAVEEQFYLMWPFVILALPSRHFLKFSGALISCTLLYRIFAFALGKVEIANALPFDSIDALAAGASLSFLSEKRWSPPRRLVWLSVAVGISGLIILTGFDLGDFVEWVILEAALLLPLVALVVFASKGLLPKILENKFVSGLGRISYGAYLYHLPIWAVLLKLSDDIGFSFSRGLFTMVTVGSLSVLFAWASWMLLERHAISWSNRWKGQSAPA
ncbi:peptidoglycan/LPS O-acetylase OafA/YrhL [Rhizobium sp. BK650]|nr:peptidoglycan/LPS O-acetylase OafA/YrhL [Rhizobium sp. BK650]